MNDSNTLNILEKIYNAIKKHSLDRTQCWTVGHVKFYKNRLTSYCTFDILASYNQESFGRCSITLINTETSFDSLTVSFKAYKESVYGTGNVYPQVTLPLSRCECDNDILGHYFYLLVDQLYHMTAF